MSIEFSDEYATLMGVALAEASAAPVHDDVPVGAIVVSPAGKIIAISHNEKELRQDPTAHAEVLAIREASSMSEDWHLDGCTLVVTLEPCVLCAGAISSARISTVVFGAWDDKAGAVGSKYDLIRDRRLPHRAEVIAGVRAQECQQLLEDFFAERR